MTQRDEEPDRELKIASRDAGALLPLSLFAGIALMVGIDLMADAREGTSVGHLLSEMLGALGATAGAIWSWRRWREERGQLQAALSDSRSSEHAWRSEAERWREEAQVALRGLSEAIDRQFARWELTGAEAEVALLMLKGLSFKEIAQVRGTSERTVRQQAQSVYRKSGVAGRAELAAFFLEDLMLTSPVSSSSPQESG